MEVLELERIVNSARVGGKVTVNGHDVDEAWVDECGNLYITQKFDQAANKLIANVLQM